MAGEVVLDLGSVEAWTPFPPQFHPNNTHSSGVK